MLIFRETIRPTLPHVILAYVLRKPTGYEKISTTTHGKYDAYGAKERALSAERPRVCAYIYV